MRISSLLLKNADTISKNSALATQINLFVRDHYPLPANTNFGLKNDMLAWLMDAATPGLEQTSESLALRLLTINFAALHSTSMVSAQYDHFFVVLIDMK